MNTVEREAPGEMTITELARRSKFSIAHISKIFTGTRRPSLRAAARIAKAKGVTLDALYEDLAPRWVA